MKYNLDLIHINEITKQNNLSLSELNQSKQKTEEKTKERLNDGNNNGQLRIATPPRVAHAKPPGPKRKERKTSWG